ncbi:MAG TPA: hypothetical protein VFV31_02405 [Chitinophagaceae bacterium]|nr:hypothetical protein [Chitinophagaceae bacterium]
MKKFLFSLLFVIALLRVDAQAQAGKQLSKADYLKKSRNQNTAAWILMGGGVTMVSAGLIVGLSDATEALGSIFTGETKEPSDAGPILFYTGAASMLGSIPLFIASSRNKRNASGLSAYFRLENRPLLQRSSFTKAAYPALALKIQF